MNVSGVVNAASVSAKNLDNLGFGVGGKEGIVEEKTGIKEEEDAASVSEGDA